MADTPNEPIAIIGMGCRFPGGANSPVAFWKLLRDGVDAIREIPPERWDIDAYYHPDRELPGKTYSRHGGFLDRVDLFDAEFFGISPREASRISPQQRLLLEVAWEALEDAGLPIDRLAGSATGVFIGISTEEYGEEQIGDIRGINAYTLTGAALSIAANRISYALDLHGPSFIVDTACSSSLVATHCACQSIWKGESELALVGGVNLLLRPERFVGFSRASMLSPDGRCRAFDARANGYVRSEGAGAVVLKPLARAVADGDAIYAVIRGTGVNQDGRTTGLSLPNEAAQEALLRSVYASAGVDPAAVSYVEMHGTGTPAGDPIEAGAVGAVLGAGRAADNPCRIGSVKTNIGHLEPGSGVAGLIKLALSLKHGVIPASLHFETPNPNIDFARLRLRVQDQTGPWPDGAGPLLAGINSFGFGGTNAHAILQAYTPPTVSAEAPATDGRAQLLPISARNAQALEVLARGYRGLLLQNPAPALHDLCYSASLRRSHHEHRAALVARTAEQMIGQLDSFLAGERRLGVAAGRSSVEGKPLLAFVFAGNGPQWWAMGRQLLEQEPVFRDAVAACERLLQPLAGWSLLDELRAAESASRMDKTEVAQPALFAIQVGLVALWRSWGIEPDAVVGHSVGEIAAAHVGGILSLEDAVRVIYHRSRTQETTAGRGKMAAAELGAEQAAEVIEGYNGRLTIAAFNAPTAVTLSGDADALQEVLDALENRQVFCRLLRLNYAFHSHHLDPTEADLRASLKDLRPQHAKVRFVSTVTGEDLAGPACDAGYWWDNVRRPVLFAAAIDILIRDGYDLFLEIGPHPVLTSYISECAARQERKALVVPSLRRKEDDRATLLGAVGALYTAGYSVPWTRLHPRAGRFVSLPTYPWQRESHWHAAAGQPFVTGKNVHPLLGQRVESPVHQWHVAVDSRTFAYLSDHGIQGSVVFPGTGYMEIGQAAAVQVFGEGQAAAIEDHENLEAMVLDPTEPLAVRTVVRPDRSYAIYAQGRGNDREWHVRARGMLARQHATAPLDPVAIADIRGRCQRELSKEEFYKQTARRNYQYGPLFQGLERVWLGDREALGEVRLPAALEGERGEYLFHPALLDACGQTTLALLPEQDGAGPRSTWLPVKVGRYRIWAQPGTRLFVHTRRIKEGARWCAFDWTVADPEGQLVAELHGMRMQALDFGDRDPRASERWLYEYQWQRPAGSDSAGLARHPNYLPSPRLLAEHLQPRAERLRRELGLERYYDELVPAIRTLCSAYVVNGTHELGWKPQPGETVAVHELMERLGIQPHHERLVRRLLQMLENDGTLERFGDEWQVARCPNLPDATELWRKLALEYPSNHSELLLLDRCGRRLGEVLRGAVDPLDLIFPESSGTAEHLVESTPLNRLYRLLLQEVMAQVASRLPPGRTLRVLEIGAGLGGATASVLPKLPPERTEYVFTDSTAGFLPRAEQKFRRYPFVQYRLFDIEQDPKEQDLEPHSFDVILGANILHEAADLRQALRHVQGLLASEGLFVVLEMTKPVRGLDLIFGLLRGWWRFTDTDLRSYPLMPAPRWTELLRNVGFTEVASVADTRDEISFQTVMLARGPQVEEPAPAPRPEVQRPPGTWLLFADSRGLGAALERRLRSWGQRVIRVEAGPAYEVRGPDQIAIGAGSAAAMQQLIESLQADGVVLTGIVHAWSLDVRRSEDSNTASLAHDQDLTCLSVVHLLQALAQGYTGAPPRLWLVSAGGQPWHTGKEPVAVAQAPLWGLGRVIMAEHPDLRCTLVDLSPLAGEVVPAEVQALADTLFTDDHEEELLIRGAARHIRRLMPAPLPVQGRVRRRQDLEETQTFRLEIPRPGVLDNLMLRVVSRCKPGPHELEIEVHAAGVNFKDVLQAMGVLAGEALEQGYVGRLSLGLECAGTVTRTGHSVVDFRPGDEVMAFGRDCFAGHVTAAADLVVRKPIGLSFEEAATIPVTFFTAYYALHHVGRLRPGERVLVHGGAGGVGLAAIQIVQHAGGEVFATAGSSEKREFLRSLGVPYVMDSRSLAFADEIMTITRGEGVHLVLNSLAGDAISKSLSVLRPLGRFLEIGKRDLLQNTKLGLRPFERCLSFHAIDIDQLLAYEPALCRTIFHDLAERFHERAFHPLPHRVFPIHQAEDAFRHMQQSRHIGKLVLSLNDADLAVRVGPNESIRIRPDASYLITGGLSGLGLATARWLVEKGARHLVLVGRSGAATPEAREALPALEGTGARIEVRSADVTRGDEVARLLAQIRQSLPPLRGVVHSAMVIDDGILLHLDRDRFTRVMDPKVAGAWNLHLHTRDLPLDFFVCYSSVVALLGTGGQGSYAAANAFLDQLAAWRAAQGLPALTVNWGPLADVGWLARHADAGERFARQGARGIPSSEALELLGRLLGAGRVQSAVMDVDWPRWTSSHSFAPTVSPRLAHLVRQDHEATVELAGDFVAVLRVAEPAERKRLVLSSLCDHVAAVLGTSAAKLDPAKPITALGLDSLMAVELQVRVQRHLGVNVPVMNLLQRQTISDLAGFVADKLALSGGQASVPGPAAALSEPAATMCDGNGDHRNGGGLRENLRETVGQESS
jgi:acyl transferase domain-containing protein/ubiquinone/menaquinone biosynthesis C-methylase UbiE/acyl carrier protein